MEKGKSYLAQQFRHWLKPGCVVLVQNGSIAKKPYFCIVRESVVKWVDGEKLELCTYVPFKHGAVIWEYWADRITPVGFIESIPFRLYCMLDRIYRWITRRYEKRT